MSVLIKGMKMPKCCIDCEFMSWSNIRQRDICEKTGEAIRTAEHWERRDILCPLVEVPTPHGRLIDEDWLCRFISTNNSLGATHYGCLTKEEIQLAPTVIESEK